MMIQIVREEGFFISDNSGVDFFDDGGGIVITPVAEGDTPNSFNIPLI